MHANVHCSTVYNGQDVEATSVSIDRGMDKGDVAHTHSGILLGHRKERNHAICSNVDGPRECHTERSKPDREGEIS